jgi:hypothetical protein
MAPLNLTTATVTAFTTQQTEYLVQWEPLLAALKGNFSPILTAVIP